jgi:hypothetical protein
MTALRRILSALWNTKGTIMKFFRKTKIFEMLVAKMKLGRGTNGFHRHIARTCSHALVQCDDSFFINKKMAAIFVKKVTNFLGDPPSENIFCIFFPTT